MKKILFLPFFTTFIYLFSITNLVSSSDDLTGINLQCKNDYAEGNLNYHAGLKFLDDKMVEFRQIYFDKYQQYQEPFPKDTYAFYEKGIVKYQATKKKISGFGQVDTFEVIEIDLRKKFTSSVKTEEDLNLNEHFVENKKYIKKPYIFRENLRSTFLSLPICEKVEFDIIRDFIKKYDHMKERILIKKEKNKI